MIWSPMRTTPPSMAPCIWQKGNNTKVTRSNCSQTETKLPITQCMAQPHGELSTGAAEENKLHWGSPSMDADCGKWKGSQKPKAPTSVPRRKKMPQLVTTPSAHSTPQTERRGRHSSALLTALPHCSTDQRPEADADREV